MELRTEARRLATIATIFIWVGWFTVIYAISPGSSGGSTCRRNPSSTSSRRSGCALAAIGGPIFLALLVAGLGHFARLFALWAGSQSNA